VVVGAGVAGAFAAREVARAGASVLLVDRKDFPRPKVCGACLNGRALAVLASAGLGGRIERLGPLPLSRFAVRLGGREVAFPLPTGQALMREALDEALVEEAIRAGADFLPATAASLAGADPEGRPVRLASRSGGATARARVVVAASGLSGLDLGGEVGLRAEVSPRSRVGVGCVVRDFSDEYRPGTIHMAVGDAGYAGLVRVGGGLLNVAGAFDRDFLKDSGGPARAAARAIAQAGYPQVPALGDARWLGTVGLTRRTRPTAAPRLFLVGDAAGYVEPFTGEGMGAALTSAQAVTPLVLRAAGGWDDRLAREWTALYRRRVGRGQALCRGLMLASRHPTLAGGVFRLAAQYPRICDSLIHALNRPSASFEAT
jgi:flavin-dependent dehydrogenase